MLTRVGLAFLLLLPLGCRAASEPSARVTEANVSGLDVERWQRAVIYFVLGDRFANGDSSNDGDAPCFDPSAPTRYHGGDLAGLARHLDYIAELGADAVWITPLSRQIGALDDACGYHGYWADLSDPDDGAIEPRLGDARALERLLATLHGRDMKLILDLVVNHAGYGARLLAQHPDWFHAEAKCDTRGAPEVDCPLMGLPDLAQERPEVAAYLDGLSARWLRRYAFDGIRVDTVKHVPRAYFADHFVPAVRAERPGLYLLGEIFDEAGYDKQLGYRAAGFDGFFDFPLRRALVESLAHGASIDRVAARIQEADDRLGPSSARLRVTFLDNHDVPRFASEMSSSWSSAEQSERHRLALALLFTIPGIPQLYYGDELGMLGVDPDNRRDMPAWAFEPGARAGDHPGCLPDADRTFDWVRRLIALRRATPALHAGAYVELWRPNGSATQLFAFLRSQGASRVLVAINAGAGRVVQQAIPLASNPGIAEADKRALLDGAALEERLGTAGALGRIEQGALWVDLPPRSIAVWQRSP